VSVVDVSLLNEKTRALVVGILAKQILTERTRIARQNRIVSITHQDEKLVREIDIPVTWLLIDEAHTLAPSKGKTAASEPLVEYAKRGRMPGCALILATQQPSATSNEILSQIDILISHNLSFSQDILELKRRTPSKLPSDLGDDGFIRNLPVGAALISDQSTSSKRTFVARIRPRVSPHGGSAISPTETEKVSIETTQIKIQKESSFPTQIEQKVEKTTIKTSTNQLKKILSDVDIPEYNIPLDIASDYLERFMKFKILYKEITINEPVVNITKISKKETNKPLELLNNLISLGFIPNKTLKIDENPVVLLNKNSLFAAFSLINTENNTIIAQMVPRYQKK
jgi:hypothetical protein